MGLVTNRFHFLIITKNKNNILFIGLMFIGLVYQFKDKRERYIQFVFDEFNKTA